jgi:hypothetical protein
LKKEDIYGGYLLMLERCIDVEDCEQVLSAELENVTFLGQVELSAEDIEKLGVLIRDKIKHDIGQGMQFLINNAPTCLSIFLVGQGIWGYREGNYWSAVAKSTGLDDINWQIRWGKFFLDFLKRKRLPQFDLEVESEGSRRYVTPILLHGGIPQNCLSEFFSRIVVSLVSEDVVEEDDVKDRLFSFREQEAKKKVLQTEIRGLKKEEEKLSEELRNLAHLINLRKKVEELAMKSVDVEKWDDLPEDCVGFFKAKESELEKVRRQIIDLEMQRGDYQQKAQAFTEDDKRILEWALVIERCQRDCQTLSREKEKLSELKQKEKDYRERLNSLYMTLWRTPWEDRYGDVLTNLSWELLAQKCSEYRTLLDRHTEQVAEQSRFVVCQPRLHPSFWLGVLLVPAGLGLVHSPLKLLGLVTLSFGFAALIGGYCRLHKEKQIESQQKMQCEALHRQISATKNQLRLLEEEISQLVSGLPLPPDCSWIIIPGSLDNLRSLTEVFCAYRDCLSEKQRIEDRLSEWERQVREVAVGAIGATMRSPDYTIEALQGTLSEARQRWEEARRAEESLRRDIEPQLRDLKDNQAKIERELDRVKERLLTLGQGDLEAGIKELNLKRQFYRELKEVETEIDCLVKLLGVSPAVSNHIEEIIELHKAKAAELENVRTRLREKERELTRCPLLFPNVDKPVERFLLYGGEWAEKWILGAVRLVDQAFREHCVPEEVTPGLPSRVVAGFKEWWKENHASEPTTEVTLLETERFSTPVLTLDTGHGEIKIVIGQHRFRFEDTGAAPGITLKISARDLLGWDTSIWDKEMPLRAYRKGSACIETETLECSVPLAGSYEISLVVDGEFRRSWQVSGLSEDRPFLVFTEDGKQLTEEILPRKVLWFFVLQGYTLPSDISIIEDATPPWLAQTCGLFLIDLSNVRTFYLVDNRGVQHQVPVTETESFVPFLSGGQIIGSASVEGAPVYVGKPPTVVIPLDREIGLEGWSIVVRYGAGLSAERKRYLVSELPGVRIHESGERAEIPLTIPELLGLEPTGRFTIRLRSTDRCEFVFSLAVVPDLLVIFEPQLFLPVNQDDSTVGLTVIVPENATFDVTPPAEIVTLEDEAYEVSVPWKEDAVKGTLTFTCSSGRCTLPLIIKLPKVRWRLKGLEGHKLSEWLDRVEEVWLGDWQEAKGALFLELELPADAGETVQLYLNDSPQFVTGELRNGGVRFNLFGFTDTLRHSKAELRIFSVKIFKIFGPRRKLICDGPLFRVRCRWKVEGIEWSLQDLHAMRQLRFEWQEKGKAQNRILRLWRLWEPWAAPIAEHIPEGVMCFVIEKEKAALPSGRYLAQFDVEDPWFAGESVSLPAERFNTAEIEISGGEPYIKEWAMQALPRGIEIAGVLVNAGAGKEITGVLCGIVGGERRVWRGETIAGPDGRFRFGFVDGEAVYSSACFAAHWFGVFADEDPYFYDFRVLPDPAPLEYSLADLTTVEIKELLELRAITNIRVRIDCQEGRLGCPILPPDTSYRVLQAWVEGQSSVEFDLQIDRSTQRVRLEWSESEVRLCLTSGVMCIGCGEILPDQQAWFEHSSGRLLEHPGLRINYVNVPVSVFLTWDFKPVIREYQRKYPLAFRDLLVLYSSRNMPLPEGMDQERFPDAEMVKLLWAKEKERAFMLLRGERKDEH